MFGGLILGILFSLNFLISLIGWGFAGFLSFIITILIVYYTYHSVIKYRDMECEGAITYGNSLTYIILSFFFAALIGAAVKYFYVGFINKEYLETLLQETYKIMDMMKFPVTEEAYDQIEKMMSPVGFAIQSIWANVLLGLLLGLIMSIFTRKEKSIFE
jgi:hypothetical protein